MSLTRLRLMQQAWGEQEMHFADPTAERIMKERYGKLTLNKARNMTAFYDILTKSDITSFEEIRHFTRVNFMHRCFSICPNLGGTLVIPESVKHISVVCFFQTQLEGIEFLAQDFKWGSYMVRQCKKLRWIKMHSIEPPKKLDNNLVKFDTDSGNNTWELYVPDISVEKYRADPNFQNLGDRIRPMSEFKD